MQKNLKITGIFAAFGFLLSFLFGLFSHGAILSILLKALIFAVVFALLGFAVSFLYFKFLGDDSRDGDSIPDTGTVAATAKGQNVDIVIQDQEIERSDSPNSFEVGSSFQMLNPSDIASGSPINTAEKTSSQVESISQSNLNAVEHNTIGEQFIPMNFKNVNSTIDNHSTANSSVSDASISLNNDETGVVTDELDTLPDLGNLEIKKSGNINDSEEDSISEYSSTESIDSGRSSFSSRNSSSENIEIKDASLMAKAISSILSGEES